MKASDGPPLASYETLVHAVAGVVGSVTAATTFFPLDTARIRLQVDEKRKSSSTHVILSEIVKEEGLLALYRGWFPVISSVCCSNFVYFYTFNSLKAMLVKGNVRATPSKDLLMGCIAGATNVFLTTPMWVVNTRLKLQGAKFRKEDIHQTEYKGILDAFRQIITKEGLGTLWNGILPSLVLVCNPGIQFMFYEGLKRKASKAGRRVRAASLALSSSWSRCPSSNISMTELESSFSSLNYIPSLEIFMIGAIAKAIATTVTYPLQIVQAILRFEPNKRSRNTSQESVRVVIDLISERIKKGGFSGLYKGLEAKLLQTVFTAALMFLIYERIAGITFKIMGLSKVAKH
ncbi:peroxisomal membrane protein PMP34 isoform X1 [Scyliorhinus canicula]|uniref:peroxisomal membrane protein PMP34 isoform X1 n=1 Tax=Scyliorhinus canicula TaxID=7830 RepID=UPI0018F3FFDF|nr:peroxisomal membrane protein PMP34 isoform X1 [Scyliorhinus canicula]